VGGDSSTHRSAGRWVQNKKTVTSGARTKYILSGFLICDHCKSRFVLVDKYNYGCGGSVGGGTGRT